MAKRRDSMNPGTEKNLLDIKLLLRPDEVAEILRISKRTVYNLYYDGRISGTKIRGCLRITSESVRRLLGEDL